MKQKVGRLRLILLSFLALIVCATACVFIGVNYGDSLTVSAALKKDESGNYILDKEEQFTIVNGVLSGISAQGYKAIGAEVNSPSAIKKPLAVHIPEGVTYIAGMAFDGCAALNAATFPESLITMSSLIFRGTNLSSVHLPKNVNSINSSFACPLTEMTVDEENPYYYSPETKNAIITKTEDGTNQALIVATSDFEITENITMIAAGAFRAAANLESFHVPAWIINCGLTTFANTDLRYITVDEGNEYYRAENNCLITIQRIGSTPADTAVAMGGGDDGIVNVPEGVVKAETNVALQSHVITDIRLPQSLADVETNRFMTNHLQHISIVENDRLYSENDCLIRKNPNGTKSLLAGTANSIIPEDEDLIEITSYAFGFNLDLETIVVPNNITKITGSAFQNSGLKNLTLSENLSTVSAEMVKFTPYYDDPANWDDGNIFYIDKYLVNVSTPISGTYKVREGTVLIADNAFPNCTDLNCLILPEGVKTLGTGLGGYANLNTIYMPSTLETAYGYHANTRLVVYATEADKAEGLTDYDAYLKLTGEGGALSAYTANKAKAGYEIPAVFTIGEEKIITKKLAGQTLGYRYYEDTQEWKYVDFSPNGYFVDLWKNDDTEDVSALDKTTPIPVGTESLSYTAMKDDDTPLSTSKELGKFVLEDIELEYGDLFVPPLDYNSHTMTMRFEDEEGNPVVRPVNVGKYMVYIAPDISQGYYWHTGNSSYKDTSEISAILEITPKVIEQLTWSDLTFTYGSQIVEVTVEFEGVNGNIIELPVTLPENGGDPLNAGKYELVAETPEGYPYKFAPDCNDTGTLTIYQHEITLDKWYGAKDFTWMTDGDAHCPEASLLFEFNFDPALFESAHTIKIYDEDGNEAEPVEEGKYKIVIALTENGNFIFTNGDDDYTLSLEFELIDKLLIHVFWENLDNWEYDGFDHTPIAYYTAGNDNTKHFLTVSLFYGADLDEIVDAIAAGDYKATVDILTALQEDSEELYNKLISTKGEIYNADNDLIYSYDEDGEPVGDGIDTVDFKIYLLKVTLGWLNYYETVAYDGNAHNPVAYYTVDGIVLVKLNVVITDKNGEVDNAINVGNYTATIEDSALDNFDTTGFDVFKNFRIEKQNMTLTVTWTAVATFVYNGEEQSPVAMLLDLDGEEVSATSNSVYTTADGKKLASAPRNVGSYKVTTTFYDEDGVSVLAETDYDFDIVKAQVVKPVVAISVFATVDLAKAYAPVGYDANTMVISGNEGDGVYTLTVGLKDTENYEWVDGKTEAESFTLKISPELSATVIGPDGVTYVTNNSLDKITLYAIIGGIGLVALIAIIALIVGLRRKAIAGMNDDDGFYDDFEEEE